MTHRQRLGAHSASLQQKAWSVRYHRARFWQFVEEVAGGAEPTSKLVKASAEFAAHDAAVYSLLDELALSLSTVSEIAAGQQSPTSFSQLPKSGAIDDDLRKLLDAQKWYEPFHTRRTGTAHAFASLVTLNETNDIRLFQQTHPKYVARPPEDLDLETARAEFREFVDGLDRFLTAFAEYVLGKFHPFDMVTMHLADTEDAQAEETTVWVRGLQFSEDFEPGREVLLDRVSGSIVLRHDSGGVSPVDDNE